MTEKPILFSGPMVRAILEGKKTQTRRVVSNLLPFHADGGPGWQPNLRKGQFHYATEDHFKKGFPKDFCLYGQPGDRLWVRESVYLWGKWVKKGLTKKDKQKWSFVSMGQKAMYEDNPPAIVLGSKTREREGWFKRPSIFMPRWASRILLEVTEVRVQRLQEISEEDAKAEGAGKGLLSPESPNGWRECFFELWDSINGKRQGCAWSDNPWVWAVSFKRIKP